MIHVIKKDGTLDLFNPEKIKVAITKSAERVMIVLTEEDKNRTGSSQQISFRA